MFVCESVSLCVCLWVCLCLCLPACLSICVFVCLFVCLVYRLCLCVSFAWCIVYAYAIETSMPMPYRCTADVPEQVNVYSDGSWLHPDKAFLSYGGAGVWWPGRTIEWHDHLKRTPLSDAEHELTYHEHGEDGFALYISIGGLTGSSTRTEPAAAIIALSARGPVHIAPDSQAFVKRALRIVKQLRNGVDKAKRWKLVSDGDLWEHFHKALKAKGPNAFWGTWVKGHATEEHIVKGITTQTHRKGNENADKIADLGANLYGKDQQQVADVYHRRHNKYYRLMKDIVIHITEAYLINKELNS